VKSEREVEKTNGTLRNNWGRYMRCSPVTTLCRLFNMVWRRCALYRVPSSYWMKRSKFSQWPFGLVLTTLCSVYIKGDCFASTPASRHTDQRRVTVSRIVYHLHI